MCPWQNQDSACRDLPPLTSPSRDLSSKSRRNYAADRPTWPPTRFGHRQDLHGRSQVLAVRQRYNVADSCALGGGEQRAIAKRLSLGGIFRVGSAGQILLMEQ